MIERTGIMEEPTVVDHKTLKALAADTRMGIIRELSRGSLTPSDLGKRLKKSDATIVEHLGKLQDSGLVNRVEEPGKKWVFYSLTNKGSDLISNRSGRFVILMSLSLIALVVGGSLLGFSFIQTGTFMQSKSAAPIPSTLGRETANDGTLATSNEILEILPYVGIALIILGILIAVYSSTLIKPRSKMTKIFGLTLILLIAISSFLPMVRADGVAINRIPPYEPVAENEQVAAINYQDGLQRMIISVDLDMGSISEAAWVFPVPANPERIVIDNMNIFPSFYGNDVVEKAKSDVDSLVSTSQLTQIYPLLFLWFGSFRSFSGNLATQSKFGEGIGGVPSVTVYEHLEKDGITTEIVTARTGEALYYYLNNRGYSIPQGSIPVLDGYIGKDYSFVISWVTGPALMGSSYRQMTGRQPGIFITFPTDRIYFPMVPTSVYGSRTIPIRLYVLGFVTPQLEGEMKSYSSTRYFSQTSYDTWNFRDFFGDVYPKGYTQIDLYAPSKYMKSDIWFDQSAPLKINYAFSLSSFISGNFLVLEIAFIMILSAASGALAGLIVFRDWRKFAVVGLSNIFSILGLLIAITFTSTKKLEEGFKKRLKEEGMIVVSSDRRKILFLIAFSIIFLALGALIGFLLKAPMG